MPHPKLVGNFALFGPVARDIHHSDEKVVNWMFWKIYSKGLRCVIPLPAFRPIYNLVSWSS